MKTKALIIGITAGVITFGLLQVAMFAGSASATEPDGATSNQVALLLGRIAELEARVESLEDPAAPDQAQIEGYLRDISDRWLRSMSDSLDGIERELDDINRTLSR